jgi:hypothetical protein
MFYYPSPNSKVYNYLKRDNRLIQALKNRYKESWEEALLEVLFNAWTQSIGDVSKFEESIAKYTTDSPYGIGPVLLNDFKLELLRLAMKSASIRRGGEASIKSIDEPGIEMSSDEEMYQKMAEMIKEFGEQTAEYFESKGKETLATLAREFFVDRKGYAEILRDNAEMFVGKKPGDLSTMMLLQVTGPRTIKDIAENIGEEYGFPKEWLDNIMSSKNLNTISDLFKDIEPTDYKEPKQSDDLIFEKFIDSNMDKIVEEIYKRLGK